MEVDKDIIFMGLAGSKMIEAAEEGPKAASEVFADRAYNDDGTLVSRKLEGSVIKDKDLAIKRVVKMVKKEKWRALTETTLISRLIPSVFTVTIQKLLSFKKYPRNSDAEGVN